MPAPRVAASARKHGITDQDAVHAFHHPIRLFELDDAMTMVIGSSRSGAQLIEVGVVNGAGGPVIVHAMRARPKFLRER